MTFNGNGDENNKILYMLWALILVPKLSTTTIPDEYRLQCHWSMGIYKQLL